MKNKAKRKSIDFGTEFYATFEDVSEKDLRYTYKRGCPVSLGELTRMTFLFLNFQGLVEEGAMVINKTIQAPLTEILKFAYETEFPLDRATPLDHPDFMGDDFMSMEANNSSCFNYREIAGLGKLSLHSYGLAVDINPMMNPYFAADGTWYPRSGLAYIHRFDLSRGMLCADHPLTLEFKKHGFEWGGDWERPDYHHFYLEL